MKIRQKREKSSNSMRVFVLRGIMILMVIFPLQSALQAQILLAEPNWLTLQLMHLIPEQSLHDRANSEYEQILRSAKEKNLIVRETQKPAVHIRAIAERIIARVPASGYHLAKDWDWLVTTIDNPTMNAFCLPGGKIIIFTGLINKLALNEEEIAIVLGHEIAHALRQHSRIQLIKSLGTRILLLIASYLLGLGDLGMLAADYGSHLLSLKYGRDDEEEADLLAIELSARAGYNPQAALSLWQKMSDYETANAAIGSSSSLEFLSTHPTSKSRMTVIRENLAKVMPLYRQSQK